MTAIQQARRIELQALKYRFPKEEEELTRLANEWAALESTLSKEQRYIVLVQIQQALMENQRLAAQRVSRRIQLESKRGNLTSEELEEYQSLMTEWIQETQQTAARHVAQMERDKKESERLAQLRRSELESKDHRSEEEEKELHLLRNTEEHDRLYREGYFPDEIVLHHPSLSLDTLLQLYPTIHTTRWESEQFKHVDSPIGSVFEVKTASTAGQSCVTYDLVRVDLPCRWYNIRLHYPDGENWREWLHQYLQTKA